VTWHRYELKREYLHDLYSDIVLLVQPHDGHLVHRSSESVNY